MIECLYATKHNNKLYEIRTDFNYYYLYIDDKKIKKYKKYDNICNFARYTYNVIFI